MKTSEYDVLVVGAGAGGAAAAWAYQNLGFKVCLVERGGWQSQSDYPANFADWETRRHSSFSYDPNIRKNPADYSVDNSESPIKVANFNGVVGVQYFTLDTFRGSTLATLPPTLSTESTRLANTVRRSSPLLRLK